MLRSAWQNPAVLGLEAALSEQNIGGGTGNTPVTLRTSVAMLVKGKRLVPDQRLDPRAQSAPGVITPGQQGGRSWATNNRQPANPTGIARSRRPLAPSQVSSPGYGVE